ncbi:hypothetical protein [Spirosoma pollinicola]|uniref:Uncharacterized protein n=1 Tax=Spirosoma pollinicola TaxID=2057025 RepID=A0A2K8Z4W4_9BACT|nr:hypothetical protein [Spirosoma pollinicola]AUD04869.1 hypothetical protein CWM47_25310 [Spirosoma pollinicola]
MKKAKLIAANDNLAGLLNEVNLQTMRFHNLLVEIGHRYGGDDAFVCYKRKRHFMKSQSLIILGSKETKGL